MLDILGVGHGINAKNDKQTADNFFFQLCCECMIISTSQSQILSLKKELASQIISILPHNLTTFLRLRWNYMEDFQEIPSKHPQTWNITLQRYKIY